MRLILNREDLIINRSHSDKSTKSLPSSSNLDSNFLLVAEYFSFNKYHEVASLKNVSKEEASSSENFHSESSSETSHPSSENIQIILKNTTTPPRTNNKNFVTPSPSSEQDIRPSSPPSDRSTRQSSLSTVTSSLFVLNLASNAASHSFFRPKRRPHHAPTNSSVYPPLKS